MEWIRDVRIGLRGLLARPGFFVVAVLTLGVGIGANTAIYSLVQAVLLQPLPFPEPDRLVQIWETAEREEVELRSLSFPMLLDLTEGDDVFEGVAGRFRVLVNLGGNSEPERVRAEGVTPSYFRLLGTELVHGRFFDEEDREPLVILSASLWERRFGADPEIVGGDLLVNEVRATIIGVASDLGLNGDAELWFPLRSTPELVARISPSRFDERGARWLTAFARMRPDVSRESLDAWMGRETERLRADHPDVMENRGVLALPLEEQMFGDVQQTVTLLMISVGLVMLVACANLASLLLARGVQREREIALRFAIGATRARVVRQLLAESIVLAALGGSVGLVLALWSKDLLRGVSLFEQLPSYVQLDVNAHTLLFTASLCLVTALLFGTVPALAAARSELSGALKSRSHARPSPLVPGRGLLVSAQVALAVVLTVASGLMVRSLTRQLRLDPGFRTESIHTLRVQLPAQRYDRDAALGFVRNVDERLTALPGVRSVALTSDVPLVDGYSAFSLTIEDWLREGDRDSMRVYHHEVSPRFFETLGVRLKGGRLFTDFDGADAPLVVVVSEKMAARAWPGENPMGKRVRAGGSERPWRSVVGVVDDVRHRNLVPDPIGNPDDPDIYVPLAQAPTMNLGIVIDAAVSVDLERARQEIQAIDAAIPVFGIRSMSEVLDAQLALPRLSSWLLGLFGAVALMLSALGLYGLLAHVVAERARDIGIRIALGARASHIVRGVVGRGLTLAGVGIALGLGGALAIGRFLESRLFEVSGSDPWTLVACAVLLAAVAWVASYLPARRATRIDPMIALRQE